MRFQKEDGVQFELVVKSKRISPNNNPISQLVAKGCPKKTESTKNVTQLPTGINHDGLVRFTWKLNYTESLLGTQVKLNFKWFWQIVSELLHLVVRSNFGWTRFFWAPFNMSHFVFHIFTCHMLMILETCWTTFVLMSILKSEYL